VVQLAEISIAASWLAIVPNRFAGQFAVVQTL